MWGYNFDDTQDHTFSIYPSLLSQLTNYLKDRRYFSYKLLNSVHYVLTIKVKVESIDKDVATFVILFALVTQ